ncbi:hypothetical protein [Aerosakkonema funiforme]|uniref:UPF0367 protein H6G03_31880 n=1 Tax=Aerosakkonema funiforme FACHB-1375 TaxID=2949571 RepID=A0A926ZM14_9CYAN|nr:hypothetical protein [Aerosakkonema funiforme]MBD2185616.1 hypothetical protein [Aerosakkonema funiforme FACHB-1375]
MFTIDLTLKNTPFPLSVQRKSEDEAQQLYNRVLDAMRSGSSQILELTCDKQPEKKIAVLSTEITAVQISQKSGAAAAGRPPGFFAMSEG